MPNVFDQIDPPKTGVTSPTANPFDLIDPPKVAPSGTGSTLGDVVNAIGTGANQGMARLAGLPADTAANVRDLLKAGAGAAYIAATGKVQPEWLQLTDRAKDIGSGENIIHALPSSMVHATNPDYEGGYLQAAGSALPALFAGNPSSLGNAVSQTGMNVASTLAGKLVGDITDSPALAIAGSMLPTVAAGAMRPTVKATPTLKSNILKDAQDAGFVVPGSQAGNDSFANARLESLAGKAAIKQDATLRNQKIANNLAAHSVGLPIEEQITPLALQKVRDDAHAAGYAPIDAIPTLNSTTDYQKALVAIDNKYGLPNSKVSALKNPEVSKMLQELNVSDMSGAEANSLIRNLREGGSNKINGSYGASNGDQNRNLGKAMISAAGAIEDLVGQSLIGTPNADLIPGLRDARKTIAQTFTVQKALNPATGDVNPSVFAKALAKGVPLTGEQELIGRFASAFPQFAGRGPSTPTPNVSALEAIAAPALAIGGHAAAGGAGMLAGAIPLLRSPVRNVLLSDWFQRNYANPSEIKGTATGVTPQALRSLIATDASNGMLTPGSVNSSAQNQTEHTADPLLVPVSARPAGIEAIGSAPDVETAIQAAQAVVDPRFIPMSKRIADERAKLNAALRGEH